MNRQALPSMLLSVFIVCFFAVVLRPVEPSGGRAVAAPPRPTPAAPIPDPPPAAPADPSRPASVDELVAVAKVEKTPEAIPRRVEEPPAESPVLARVSPEEEEPTAPPRLDDRIEPRIVDAPVPPISSHSPEPPSVPAAATPPAPVALAAVPEPKPKPEPEPESKSDPKLEPEAAPVVEVMTIPRGEPETTVVGQGETLEDVALRVYGVRAAAATLREANRGLVGRLRPGALIWTPPL